MAQNDVTLAEDSALSSESMLGAVLKKAREDKSLSIEQVCARLRISARQVNAMETDDFDVLGDAMIVRGFIRNYAKLLEIDPEPLVTQYMASKPNSEPKSLSLNSANIAIQSNSKQDWQKYVGMSLLIAVLVAVWYFYTDYQATHLASIQAVKESIVDKHTETSELAAPQATIAPAEQSVANSATSSTHPETTTDTSQQPAAPVEALSAQNQTQFEANSASPDPASISPAAEGVDQLRVNTGEASWVHVLDADNKVILDAIVPANGEALAEGKAPFSVVIGNAPVATIQFNHQSIDLMPYTKGRVARLKLE